MVSVAQYSMYPILKKLWRTSFGDGEAYTDFIFSRIPPEQILVFVEDKAVAAMLCWQPLELVTPCETIPAAYMFGFNTHPSRRGKGIGAKLIDGLQTHLLTKGYEAVCLAPATESLFEYYGKHGYETIFDIKTVTVSVEEISPSNSGCVLVSRGFDKLYHDRNKFFASERLYARWGGPFLHVLGEECRFRGGDVLRVSCIGEAGYVVCLPPVQGKMRINEFAIPEHIFADVLYALHKRFGAQSFEIRLSTDYIVEMSGSVLPFVMIKWYDKKSWGGHILDVARAPYFAHILD